MNSHIHNFSVYVGKQELVCAPLLHYFFGHVWLDGYNINAKPELDFEGLRYYLRLQAENKRLVVRGLFGYFTPKEQIENLQKLRDFLLENPNIHIVASTNSPIILDECHYDEVTVVTNSGEAKLLTSHPHWDKWKDHLLPGEFWQLIGEEW